MGTVARSARRWSMAPLVVAMLLVAACTGGGPARSARSSRTSPIPRLATPSGSVDNPIREENLRSGSENWQLGLEGYRIADDTAGQIKGYASATSVDRGGAIDFFVSVNPSQAYRIDVYRLGWYGGTGGRLVWSARAAGSPQPQCPEEDTLTGLIECHWTDPIPLQTEPSWTSGVYVAVLTNSEKYQNWVPFVLRDDEHHGAILALMPFATYDAYNNYPDDHLTGKSLYGGGSYGPRTITKTTQAVKVSFDRPFARDGAGKLGWADIDGIRWLEQVNYDVSYITDIDVHENPSILLGAAGVVVMGHSEYWTWQMYTAFERARDAGVGLAFLGANDVYRQIRLERSSSGTADRVVVGYKYPLYDPIQGPKMTIEWRNPPVNRPEQELIGIQYISRGGDAPFVAMNTWNWVYAGTGMHDGDEIPHLVSSEYDAAQLNYPAPPNRSYVLLSRSPVEDISGRTIYSNSSIYQAPSGSWVFAPGTKEWTGFLDDYSFGQAEPRVERMTENVLDRFIDDSDQGAPRAGTPVAKIEPGRLFGSAGVPVRLEWSGGDTRGAIVGYQFARGMDGAWWGPGTPTASDSASISLLPAHEYRFRVRAYDDRGDVSSWAEGDWFTVSIVNGGNGPIGLAGRWRPGDTPQTFCSKGPSSAATLHFTGTDIAWIGPTGPGNGKASVVVDAAPFNEQVDLGRFDASQARVITAHHWPSPGIHTMIIYTLREPVCIGDFVVVG